MSVKGIRRMLVGEDMPDKNDPKYKKRYEKEVAAGRKFAKTARIDRAAAKVQGFANAHKTLFLVIVFGFVATCFGINIYRMVRYYGHRTEAASAIERQEGRMKQMMNAAHCITPPVTHRTNEENRDKSVTSKSDSDENKINFRQPKYMLPAIVYIPLIATGYFVFDMFNTEVAETQDKNLQTTEFLNPNLPGAQIKNGDGIGGKYENMAKSYGRIADYSAVDNIERDNEEEKEAYESKYTEEDLAELVRQAEEKDDAAEVADAKAREAEALEALNKALAEARLRGQAAVAPVAQDTTQAGPPKEQIEVKGQIAEDSKAVKALDEEDKAQEVKKVKVTSDYFNTLTQNEHEPKLIKAIIDEDVKATDGSRVRLRLLDDIEIGETVVKKGSYLYATMSGFGSQRVKGSINSILVDDELIKVSLSLYDTDGLEGLYVPGSQFRETTKDVASGAMQSNMNIDQSGANNSFSQWGMQAVTNAYQKTSNAISKAIKKNKVKLKYGTFVYLVNGKEKRK